MQVGFIDILRCVKCLLKILKYFLRCKKKISNNINSHCVILIILINALQYLL